MKKLLIATAALSALALSRVEACTNFIITRGASTDSSVMVTYAADSHQLYGALYYRPARDYRPGETLKIYEWDTGRYLGEIPQVAHTYQTVGNMNEHQLIIGETTYGGRPELEDSTGIMDYGSLIYITLQRAKTAREAIDVIVNLANTYGYASSGESFSIADPDEAWIFEMIGKGCKMVNGKNVNKGIVWVARRIPDGYVCAHANQARITQFPKDDPENCLYAPDVISFAREAGLYNGTDADFSFCDTYAPLDFSGMRGCEARVWSMFRRITPGMDRYLDYALGKNPENRMPLWVKPAKRISPKEVMDFMRDHYEDTPMDMRYDIGAGGHHLPYRWRPMGFEVDGVKYLNERATATQQTGFWFMAQARNYLPDPIGGVYWFGVDDAGTSCLTPIYCSVTEIPECFREGNGHMTEYSPTSAFWLFNRVTNFAYLRYDMMSADILKVVNERENGQLKKVQQIDAKALSLYKTNPEAAIRLLTDYSVKTAQEMFDKWVELDRYLLVKYMDGNVKKERNGKFLDNGYGRNIPASPDFPGYNDEWKKAVAGSTGDRLKEIEIKK
ncbi:dipeptidase [Gallalistipes aquisgranensis]|uniref:dipeptidase n=1 Tax=Gallalistipes aquisgranensis TaxID=2779358 RepID=UPI001CF8EE1C|nr:C69 family dipeptidase [Gallalistipes aquisgranensis]MBE5032986.1 C69 family dipeptidase [Gallalistipes aquisgranensis]